jgi:hypothetical protein
MKKLLLILVLLFTSNLLYAVEIKLSCDITTKYTGYSLTEKERVIFIVTEFKDFVSIIPIASSASIPSVTSTQSDNNIVFNDSNENTWSVRNKQTLNGKNYEQQIEIDRGTGQISFKNDMIENKDPRGFRGTGICEKIDIKKKKF